MKRTLYAILLFASLSAVVQTTAQNEGVSRRVDITRDYTVGVQSADKLSTPVQQSDTTIVRPTLSFGIRPTDWNSSFAAAPLQAASLSASEWVRQSDLYLKAAAGYPWRTALDLYYTPIRFRRSTLGFYINHEGIEGMVTNLMNERRSALSLQNRAGAFYEHYGRLSTFTIYIAEQFDFYNPYGGYDPAGESGSQSDRHIRYNRLSGEAKLAGRFSDGDDLSYSAALEAEYFAGKSYGDRHRCTDYDTTFEISGIGGDSTSLFVPSEIRFGHSACICPAEGYHNVTVSLSPRWHFRLGDNLPVALGMGYLFNSSLHGGHNNFTFDADLRYDRMQLLTPFVAASRQMTDNNFDRLVERNPYLRFGTGTDNSMKTSFAAGVEGAKSAFSYRISGGAEIYDRYTSFCLIEGRAGLFETISAPLTLWYAAAEFMVRTSQNFVIELSGRWNSPRYGTGNPYRQAFGIPDFETGAGFGWTIARRLVLRAGVEVRGAADHLVHYGTPVGTEPFEVRSLPATCNLKSSIEYSVNSRISAFLEADNMLDQTIYEYYSYPRLGFGVMGGVKMTF